jgi:hypothetical protein
MLIGNFFCFFKLQKCVNKLTIFFLKLVDTIISNNKSLVVWISSYVIENRNNKLLWAADWRSSYSHCIFYVVFFFFQRTRDYSHGIKQERHYHNKERFSISANRWLLLRFKANRKAVVFDLVYDLTELGVFFLQFDF